MGLLNATDQFVADNGFSLFIIALALVIVWCTLAGMMVDAIAYSVKRYNYARMYSASKWVALKIALRRN